MKNLVWVASLALLSACQVTPPPAPPPAEPQLEVMPEQPEPAPQEEPQLLDLLKFTDEPATLQAWLDYKQSILAEPEAERQRLMQLTEPDEVAQFQFALLSLHPDMPYVSRFKVQTQLTEMLLSFPPRLAAIFSWELTYNQKLLEAESAVSAVTRLNAQQLDQLERLQKTNRELQKKIDALTQIEAELNQQPVENNGGNNGPG
ncbi:MAG: hypothetical protein ACK4ML_06695 [Alishewanella aestuarii]